MSQLSQMSKNQVKNLMKTEQRRIDDFVGSFKQDISDVAQQIHWELFPVEKDEDGEEVENEEDWDDFFKDVDIIKKHLMEELNEEMMVIEKMVVALPKVAKASKAAKAAKAIEK